MATIVIKPDQLAGALRAEARFVRGAMKKARGRAARRGVSHLIARADEKGKTYLGQFRGSFHVSDGDKQTVVFNDAPHAGIIELGARPHPVSEEGRAAITRWVLRKLEVADEIEAARIADRIVWKLRHKGQKGTYLFRDALPHLTQFFADAVRDLIREGAGRRKSPSGAGV